mmetsp:Transcript_66050/g.185934  ORF Transcript_66050/g.185934 Transcript_66050/m.185934 type:complete len:317 (-) Transcript_66050:378-1328(-)
MPISMFSSVRLLRKMKTRKSIASGIELCQMSKKVVVGPSSSVPQKSNIPMVSINDGKMTVSSSLSVASVLKTKAKTNSNTTSTSNTYVTGRIAIAMPFSNAKTSGKSRSILMRRPRRAKRKIRVTCRKASCVGCLPARISGISHVSSICVATSTVSNMNHLSFKQHPILLNAQKRMSSSRVKKPQNRCSATRKCSAAVEMDTASLNSASMNIQTTWRTTTDMEHAKKATLRATSCQQPRVLYGSSRGLIDSLSPSWNRACLSCSYCSNIILRGLPVWMEWASSAKYRQTLTLRPLGPSRRTLRVFPETGSYWSMSA